MDVSRIIDGLFLSGHIGAKCQDRLRDLKITHILTLGNEWPSNVSSGFEHKVVPKEDLAYEDLLSSIPEITEFIETATTPPNACLVHCHKGISRSCTAVAGFLMKFKGMTAQQALAQIQQSRPQCHPNPGFQRQLRLFERMSCSLRTHPLFAVYKGECDVMATKPYDFFQQRPGVSPSPTSYITEANISETGKVAGWESQGTLLFTELNVLSPLTADTPETVTVEELEWMDPTVDEVKCPTSGAVLGKLDKAQHTAEINLSSLKKVMICK
eukprot:TRINITY_DN112393_c0_g1_i1.p1 TRINITY_DN112393_c0_g1~~TRINITY_DN112393_c0_g1_i1.p1  ORF type:complete len:305 (+),score=30.53 TRINITY_DN112393_c0_g1_i1:108-917(+)